MSKVGKRRLFEVGLEALPFSKKPKTGLRKEYPRSVSSPGFDEESGAKKDKPSFLNRLSRIVVPHSPLEFKSPLFLRRFNLNASVKSSQPGPALNNSRKQLPHAPLLSHAYEPATSALSDSARLPKVQCSQLDSIYSVIKPYVKRLNDEITVCIGEKVKILKFHSDGWATVKMVTSDDSGVIPLMCLRKGAYDGF